jgi:hypothetical protein
MSQNPPIYKISQLCSLHNQKAAQYGLDPSYLLESQALQLLQFCKVVHPRVLVVGPYDRVSKCKNTHH